MKFRLAALLLVLAYAAHAQNAAAPPEPASMSIFYYLNSAAQLVPLESQTVQISHHFHDLGFAGGSTVYQAKGDKSPVRLEGDAKQEFVVRLEGSDPLESVLLGRFDPNSGSRIMPIGEFNAWGQAKKLDVDSLIDFNAVRYGDSSMKVVTINPLGSGEYCFIFRAPHQSLPEKTKASCFGVDSVTR